MLAPNLIHIKWFSNFFGPLVISSPLEGFPFRYFRGQSGVPVLQKSCKEILRRKYIGKTKNFFAKVLQMTFYEEKVKFHPKFILKVYCTVKTEMNNCNFRLYLIIANA